MKITSSNRIRHEDFLFSVSSVSRGAIQLSGGGSVDNGSTLTAFVSGVPIGSGWALRKPGADTELTVALECFPFEALPCEIRFAFVDGKDVCAPHVVKSVADVERLVGPGQLEDVELSVDAGVCRGTAINRVNGCAKPFLVARINGETMREVVVEGPFRVLEGGGRIRFSFPLLASDLVSTGMSAGILALPQMMPVAALHMPRIEGQDVRGALQNVEAGVASLEKRLSLELARLSERIDLAGRTRDKTDDELIEYIMALSLDNMTRLDSPVGPDVADVVTRFHQIRESVRSHAQASPVAAARLPLLADSMHLCSGWSLPEDDARGQAIRWMGLQGAIVNPHPDRSVEQVLVTVPATVDGQRPQISALFDADPVEVVLLDTAGEPPYTLALRPLESTGGRDPFSSFV